MRVCGEQPVILACSYSIVFNTLIFTGTSGRDNQVSLSDYMGQSIRDYASVTYVYAVIFFSILGQCTCSCSTIRISFSLISYKLIQTCVTVILCCNIRHYFKLLSAVTVLQFSQCSQQSRSTQWCMLCCSEASNICVVLVIYYSLL